MWRFAIALALIVMMGVVLAPQVESDRNARKLDEPSVDELAAQFTQERYELERQWGIVLNNDTFDDDPLWVEEGDTEFECVPGYLSCPNPLGWVWWCDPFCNWCYRASC